MSIFLQLPWFLVMSWMRRFTEWNYENALHVQRVPDPWFRETTNSLYRVVTPSFSVTPPFFSSNSHFPWQSSTLHTCFQRRPCWTSLRLNSAKRIIPNMFSCDRPSWLCLDLEQASNFSCPCCSSASVQGALCTQLHLNQISCLPSWK